MPEGLKREEQLYAIPAAVLDQVTPLAGIYRAMLAPDCRCFSKANMSSV